MNKSKKRLSAEQMTSIYLIDSLVPMPLSSFSVSDIIKITWLKDFDLHNLVNCL